MINVSSAFKKKLSNDERDYIEKIDMTLADGTVLNLTNKDIWGSSLIIDDAVGGDSTFSAVGSAIVNSCSFTINNIYDNYSQYDFTDAVATVKIGLNLGTADEPNVEYVDKGVFTVNETTYNGSMINVKMYDNMFFFDRPYSESTLIYGDNGRRLLDIIHEACEHCDVELANSSETFPQYNTLVKEPQDKNAITYREVISWVATIAGCFARCNTSGELELKWFDVSEFEKKDGDLDGGIFDPAVRIETDDSVISTHISANGVTFDYDAESGWWHIVGTPNTASEIDFPLYENVISQSQNTYTLRIETKALDSMHNPLNIGINYWPDDGSILYDVVTSPHTVDMYSLTELSLVIPETSGSRTVYDGYARIIIEIGDTSSYTSGDDADGGVFNPWEVGTEYNGGNFTDPVTTNIYGLFSHDIGTDDVVITKVRCNTKSDEELTQEQIGQGIVSENGIISYSTGADGYEIVVENNQFITASNIKDIIDYLGTQLIGLRFRKVNVNHLSDPTMEAGDVAYVWDRKSNRYQILVTRTSFALGSAQTTVCGASTPLRNSASRFSDATKSYVEARNMVVRTKSDLEKKLEQAGGLYDTLEVQQDGSSIRYFHNKPELSESDIRIIISSVGITVTANGLDEHPNWYGLTVDGDLIAEILSVTGITADWINAGQIAITKDSGEEVFFADFISKTVRIHADTILMQSGDNVEVVIAQTTDDLAALKMHYRFDETGETIGREGSSKSLKLSNDGINMMVDNESVTRWTQDEMYTPTRVKVPVGGSLQLGDFIFQPRSSGNISLLFVGGD